MLDQYGRPLEAKASEVSASQLAGLVDWIGYRTASGQAVTWRDAVRVSAFFCGVRVLAEGLAQAGAYVQQEQFDTDRQAYVTARVPDHPVTRLLRRRPNSWQTPFQFIEFAVLAACTDHGFLAVKVADSQGVVRELLPIPMGCWTVEQNPDYTLTFTVTYADKTHGRFKQDQVLHFTGPSFDGFSGASVIGLAREALGLSQSLEKQQARMSGRGGLPSGVISFDGNVGPEEVDRIKAAWSEKYGPSGDGGVAVLDGAAKFYAMTMTSVDAQHIETRRFQIEEVARLLRIQPLMLMQSDKAATFASAEQMFRYHVIHTLAPWMQRFEQTGNRDLLGNSDTLAVSMDERRLLRGDFKDQADYYGKALGAGGQPGWMSVNNVRAEMGMNPVNEPWADEIPRGLAPRNGAEGQE